MHRLSGLVGLDQASPFLRTLPVRGPELGSVKFQDSVLSDNVASQFLRHRRSRILPHGISQAEDMYQSFLFRHQIPSSGSHAPHSAIHRIHSAFLLLPSRSSSRSAPHGLCGHSVAPTKGRQKHNRHHTDAETDHDPEACHESHPRMP